MFIRLLFLFTAVPLVELVLLIEIGRVIGPLPTVAIVIATGILGAALARFQGLLVVRNIQLDLHEGRMPAEHLLDGVLILLAGAVLLTPGILTDLLGFALLTPVVRTRLRHRLRDFVEHHFYRVERL